MRYFLRHCGGATAIEYALIASLVSIVILVAVRNLGVSNNTTMTNVQTEVTNATAQR